MSNFGDNCISYRCPIEANSPRGVCSAENVFRVWLTFFTAENPAERAGKPRHLRYNQADKWPRQPCVEFPGAIYHIITRGDGRRMLFHDDGHYDRLTRGLKEEVTRSGWKVLSYCWMPNHIHLLLQTPEPNLARGMQHWLSGYANGYAKRNRRVGHLFQVRYKAFLVQDAGYFWSLSRYIHLNPCSGLRPLVATPDRWIYSSYPGFARKTSRLDWIAYDDLHSYWQPANGGKDAGAAYKAVRQSCSGA